MCRFKKRDIPWPGFPDLISHSRTPLIRSRNGRNVANGIVLWHQNEKGVEKNTQTPEEAEWTSVHPRFWGKAKRKLRKLHYFLSIRLAKKLCTLVTDMYFIFEKRFVKIVAFIRKSFFLRIVWYIICLCLLPIFTRKRVCRMNSPTRKTRRASPSPEFSFAVPRRAVCLTKFFRKMENGTVTIKKRENGSGWTPVRPKQVRKQNFVLKFSNQSFL